MASDLEPLRDGPVEEQGAVGTESADERRRAFVSNSADDVVISAWGLPQGGEGRL